MEPRIASLLGDTLLIDRNTIEQLSSLHSVQIPPPSVAPRRPLPVEPRDFVDETRASKNSLEPRASKPSLGHEFINKDFYAAFPGPPVGPAVVSSSGSSSTALAAAARPDGKPKAASRHAKSTIPLTEVLNSEQEDGPAVATAAAAAAVVVFSGSLSDILLDGGGGGGDGDCSSSSPRKKRKLGGNELLTLPKPHPPAKKGARRPRIPPLLQGLHQPPPDAGLFPPITGDGFKGALVERPAQETREVGPGARAAGAVERVVELGQGGAAGEEGKKGGKTKKRNKWTEQETKDLLRGVAKFGIGNWKKILECKDYVFRDRTSVDLKDRFVAFFFHCPSLSYLRRFRQATCLNTCCSILLMLRRFRTCCPDEYSKYRASDSSNPATPSKSAKGSHEPKDVTAKPSQYYGLYPPQIEPSEAKAPRRPRSGTDRKGPAELAEMGIDRPFFKNKRRERREFTERDDEALIRGFEKHGPVWHNIRSDPELGFGSRHPTDLRDRFRTRFPEKYAQAGYKVKPKDAQKQRDRSSGAKSDSKEPANSDQAVNRLEVETPLGAPPSTISAQTPSDTRSKPHNLLKPLLTTFPGPFDDFPDLASEDEASHSPITLSRNIFQWADAHPPHSTNAAMTNMPAIAADITSHLNFNLLAGMDQYHINPLATLNLPSATSTSFPINLTATGANISSSTTMAPIYSSSSTKQTQNLSQYPPSLPTLTFPSSSLPSGTRSGAVNLPPPADLLSGLDLDERTDVHNPSSLWEDGMALGMGAIPTSAAVIGTGAGAGSAVVPIRGLFESDGLGERSLLNSSV